MTARGLQSLYAVTPRLFCLYLLQFLIIQELFGRIFWAGERSGGAVFGELCLLLFGVSK